MKFSAFEVDNNEFDQSVDEILSQKFNYWTYPKIWFGTKFIGGYTDLIAFAKTEEFQKFKNKFTK